MAVSPVVAAELAPLKAQAAELMKQAAGKTGDTGTKSRTPTPSKEAVFGLPTERRGENIMSSRGFQFQRLIGVVGRSNDSIGTPGFSRDNAKIELELCERLHKHYVVDHGFTQYQGGSWLAPLGTELMGGADEIADQLRTEIKSLTCAGVAGIDKQEMDWVRRKAYRGEGKTPQSWIDETYGGALVAPPEFGELIQLLRNKDALINAGCRVIPLPPSGRLKYPRQTSPTTGYFIGENTSITASNFKTGSLLLSAKKCAALVSMPNELIRFASPASEAILRADMTKTLSLTFDQACLEGGGSDNVPLGAINTPGIATVAATTAPSGNTLGKLSPQDLYAFISAVEANNAEFQGWIMRPELFYTLVGARASVYNGSTTVAQGQFTFDQFRQLGMGFPKVLAGYPVVTTAQVSITRTQGSAANGTYVIGGQWDDSIMALFGSIEFAQATQGDTAFAQDQTVVRGILTGDFGLRHSGAFAWCDAISLTTMGQ